MKKSNSKNLIIGIAVVVVAAGAYFYFSGEPVDDSTLLVSEVESSDAALAGSRVLTLLNQINSLKIDAEFFKSEAYSSLVDHTVPIYEQNVGKKNPFYSSTRRTSGN